MDRGMHQRRAPAHHGAGGRAAQWRAARQARALLLSFGGAAQEDLRQGAHQILGTITL